MSVDSASSERKSKSSRKKSTKAAETGAATETSSAPDVAGQPQIPGGTGSLFPADPSEAVEDGDTSLAVGDRVAAAPALPSGWTAPAAPETYDFLGVQLGWHELLEIGNSRWLKKFVKSGAELGEYLCLALPDCEGIEDVEQQIRRLDRQLRKRRSPEALAELVRISVELANPDADPRSIANQTGPQPLARLAVAYQLPAAWDLAPMETAEYLRRCSLAMIRPLEEADMDPWAYFCDAIELPLVIAATFEPSERGQAIGSAALETFRLFMERFFSEEGWIAPGYIDLWGALTAGIIRVRKLVGVLGLQLSTPLREQSEWVCLQITRMADGQGQTQLASGWISDPELFLRECDRLTEDGQESRLYRTLLDRVDDHHKRKLPSPGDYSETSQMGVLRSDWKRKSPRVAVAVTDEGWLLEIGHYLPLIRGLSQPQVTRDGETVEFSGPSSMNCWHEEPEVFYLELEQPLVGGGVWQRQLALDRLGKNLVVCDAYVGSSGPQTWDYECLFPLADNVATLPEVETREIYLKDERNYYGSVIPLTLGEWRSDRLRGEFSATEDGLLLQQKARGASLFAAVVFELDAKRCLKPRTWRNLTVGEHLQIVRPDVAVAFRYQLGSEQWLLYRSLTKVGNRTFLGQNVHADFCWSRFQSSGLCEKIIEIE